MKLLLALSIFMLLSFTLHSQDLQKFLESKTWQTTGDLTSPNEKPVILKIKVDSLPDYKIQFSPSNRIESTHITKLKEVDLEGNEVPPGTYFISSYRYELVKDILKVYQKISHKLSNEPNLKTYAYKVIPASDKLSVELIPVKEKSSK